MLRRASWLSVLAGVVLGLAGIALPLSSQGAGPAPQRVVSLGGSVTEIIYALGMGHVLVGDDLSSVYPRAATQLPRVGYYRALSLEGLISLQPDLILASENAGPPAVLERVRSVGVPVIQVSDGPDMESLYRRIQQISRTLNVSDRGNQMVQQLRNDIQAVQNMMAHSRAPDSTPGAVVLMKRSNQFQVAGGNTTAAAVLELSGLSNMVSHQTGYRSLSTEGLLALNPDIIVVTAASVQAAGGLDAFRNSPGVAPTRAAQSNHIVVMDDLLILGMGPRTPQAVRKLYALSSKAGANE